MEIQEKMMMLMELYEKDKELNKIKNLENEVPQKIEELNKKLDELWKEFEEEKKSIEKIDEKRRELEREVEEQRLNLENFKKRKMEVQTNKEFLTLKREIENTEKKITELEDELIEVYLEKEEQEKKMGITEDSFNEKKNKVEKTKKSLSNELKESKEDLIIKEDERNRIAARLKDENLLRKYNRLKESRGNGAALIEEEICTECHSTIPPQLFAEVRKGDKIITCHSCGRILIYKWIE